MAINVADNFSYKGGKPLDARTKYTSVADMVATPAADLYDGCLAYVTATKKNYQYDSTNDTDPTLGKWRELQTGGGGGADYTAGDGIDITDDTISIDPMPSGDMSEIISPLPKVTTAADFKEENNILWYKDVPYMGLNTINIYVNSATGVDDYEGGYGFSEEKPFATIEYAIKYFPIFNKPSSSVRQIYANNLHVKGNFSSETLKTINFEFPNQRFYIYIDSDVTLTNIQLSFLDCAQASLRLSGGNLTCNCDLTNISSAVSMITFTAGKYFIEAQNQTAQNQRALVINGNATAKANIWGIAVGNNAQLIFKTANSYLEVNHARYGVNVYSASIAYFATLKGSDLTTGIQANEGARLSYNANSMTATQAKQEIGGGRIYTGSPS